ncbi:hypothetical protein D9M68_468420 [compost metagenome]
MGARDPAQHQLGEQPLELGAVLRGIAQHVQGFGFFREQVGEQGADHSVGIEFIERRVDLNRGGAKARGIELRQGGLGGMLLAAQVAAVAAIQAQAQLCEVRTEYLGLANADG